MDKKSILKIVLAGILWGTSPIFVKLWASFGLATVDMTTARIVASFLCFLLFVLVFHRDVLRCKLKELPFYIGTGITLFGTAYFYYEAIQRTSASAAEVLMYTAPVLVLAWSVIFFKERLTILKIVSVAAILVGCALVSGVVGDMHFDTAGIIFGLLSGVSYATYNIVTNIEMRKGFNPMTSTVYSFFFAAITALIACDFSNIATAMSANIPLTVGLAFLHGIITFVVPYFLYTLSLKNVPASTASALAVIEPLTGAIIGITLLGDEITVFSIIGIVMILTSVVLISRQ